jgi:predicted RNA binding protein YcfA (HicA-like mRNA interferase family)
LRIAGSDYIYGKAGSIVHVSVPIHATRPLEIGLARHLLKAADIDPDGL